MSDVVKCDAPKCFQAWTRDAFGGWFHLERAGEYATRGQPPELDFCSVECVLTWAADQLGVIPFRKRADPPHWWPS